MDSLGDFLKEERLKLKVNLNQIAKDTNIPIKYLEAIENDEYSAFPGEAYLKGFLRTYCKYINLDPDEIVNKYDRIKIAETPTPIEKLIPKPRANIKPAAVFAAIIIIPILITMLIIFATGKNKNNNTVVKIEKQKKKKDTEKKVFEISEPGSKSTFDLRINNIIALKIGENIVHFKIKQINPYVILTDKDEKEYILFQEKTKDVDIDNNLVNDAGFLLNHWDNEKANVTINLYSGEGSAADENKLVYNTQNSEIIYKKENPEDIRLNLKTNTAAFIKYKIDDNDDVENYYNSNSDVKIEAKKKMIIWLSNAGAVTFNFKDASKEYKPGNPGEVIVKLLEWKRNTNGEFELQIASLN